MFSSSSSSVINSAAAHVSSNLTHHHQLLQVLSSYSDVFSDQHYTNLLTGMVAQDAQHHDDQVPRESTIINSFGSTTIMNKKHGSDARVTKKKSDKRSKIKTSQGLRDRRVRLSIDIARKFFDLQDLLGFEQPSRTVEWLLTKSNKAILQVSGASSSTTSSSSSEAPGTEDGFKISFSSINTSMTCSTVHQLQQVSCDDYMKITMNQKPPMLTRESRERARARARARTLAKLSNASQCEEIEQKLHQIHSYVVPNSNLLTLADWNISSVNIPDQLPSNSSATNPLNLSRDVDQMIYNSRSSWDQMLLLNNYRTML